MIAADLIVKALRNIRINVNAAVLTQADSTQSITAGKIVTLALRKMGVRINEDTLNPPSSPTLFRAGDLIEKAFSKLAILTDQASLTSVEQANAIDELNNMMLEMEASGINLGYTVVSSTTDTITTPNWSWRMMYTRLAVIIASEYGKQVPEVLLADAQKAYQDAELAIQYQDTLQQLNDIMSEYEYSQLDLGYTPVSSFNDNITTPNYSWKMIYTRLAVALSEEYGKDPTPLMLQELVSGREDMIRVQQYQQTIQYLNDMMRTLEASGVVLGWTPCRDFNSEITVPDWAIDMIVYRLAITLAPQYPQAQMSAALQALAKDSYDAVMIMLRQQIQAKLPSTMPLGSGNQSRGSNGTFGGNFVGDQTSDDILTGIGDGLQNEEASQLKQDNY